MFKRCLFVFFLITSPCVFAVDIKTGQDSLEFHGYFRSGSGFSEAGATQARFQAPGTRASYRLGNEPDTNLELQLDYNYVVDESDKSYANGTIMIDGYKPHGVSSNFTISNLAQSYVSFNRFFKDKKILWMGRRYYDRKSIHILDHTWLNPGQGAQSGFGIEDIHTGSGKLNFSLFQYEDNFDISGTSYLLNSSMLDIRLHDLEINQHLKLTLWGGISSRESNAALNYKSNLGYGIGAWLDSNNKDSTYTTAFIFQTGSAITQGDYNAKPIREDLGWNLKNASVIEINNTWTEELLPSFSFQWTILARQEDRGLLTNSQINWYSTGVRPILYYSKHTSLAFEAGIDYVDDKINNRKGSLSKLTAALQINADKGFYNRPTLRFFVTVADWSDDFKGLIGSTPGNAPYANATQGWSIGSQVEVWW